MWVEIFQPHREMVTFHMCVCCPRPEKRERKAHGHPCTRLTSTCRPRRSLTSDAFSAACRCSTPLPPGTPWIVLVVWSQQGAGHCAMSLPTKERQWVNGKSRWMSAAARPRPGPSPTTHWLRFQPQFPHLQVEVTVPGLLGLKRWLHILGP